MWRKTAVLISVLLMVVTSHAQETPDTGWPIVEQCLGEFPFPSIPQSRWDFEGMIFNVRDDGVHAMRSDLDTPYFVAFDNSNQLSNNNIFSRHGDLSPDGRWFILGLGRTFFLSTLNPRQSFSSEIVIVNTTPRRGIALRMPSDRLAQSRVEDNSVWRFASRGWLDTTLLMGPDGTFNIQTGEMITWNKEIPLSQLSNFSPDLTRAFHRGSLYDAENDVLLTDTHFTGPQTRASHWLPNSSGFISTEYRIDPDTDERIFTTNLFDRNGDLLDLISQGNSVFRTPRISPDGKQLAFLNNRQLFIADLQDRVITDLCFDNVFTGSFGQQSVAWSPDSQSFVFAVDGYPVIVNAETLDMQVLRYRAGAILGWHPIPLS